MEANTDTWIGFFTNLNEVTLIVKYLNSPLSNYSATFTKMSKLILYDP